jgi:hypothetical protein
MEPNEIVDVALPQPDEKSDAFAKRGFPIRIQTK